jgi:hypothetical protein
MKFPALPHLFFLATGALLLSAPASLAATFGQTEVDQSKFIAIAVPRTNQYYNFMILEQVSDARPCWREDGRSPTTVDPLLLTYNFSGICGRSTDSNGYSIRHNGQDLGLSYRLSIEPRGRELVLVGVPLSSQTGPTVEIGRTRGISDGVMKLELDSGWKFTKRNYQGKTLGHVYLTREGDWPSTSRSNPPSRSRPEPTKPEIFQSAAATQQAKATPDRNILYRLYVRPRDARDEAKVKSLVPSAFRSTYRGQTVLQVGLFSEQDKAKDYERNLERQGLQTTMVEEQGTISPPIAAAIPARGSVLSVPGGRIPLGNASGDSATFGNGLGTIPPPPPGAAIALAPRYRVLVPIGSASEERKVRGLVKDAFRSSYQGRSMMQVGSFTDRAELDSMVNLMQRNGLNPVVSGNP